MLNEIILSHGHNWWPIWLASTCFTMYNRSWKTSLTMVGHGSETHWTVIDHIDQGRPWSIKVWLKIKPC